MPKGGVQVFNRLHNQAIVRQKKQKETFKQTYRHKQGKSYLSKSKSGYIQPQGAQTHRTVKRVKKLKEPGHIRTKTTSLAYDANAGHRLYVKNRGLSSRRERSINKIRAQQTSQLAKTDRKLSKTTLLSSRSKWVLNEKSAKEHFEDMHLDRKDLFNTER